MLQVNTNLDKARLANCFNRAANSYDKTASLQHQVGGELINLLAGEDIDPHVIIDVGGGTGYLAGLLAQRYRQADIVLTDLAHRMLRTARTKLSDETIYVAQADFSALPFADGSVDVIFANMSLHWSLNLRLTLLELKRVLKPTGILVFSLPAAGTFYELSQCLKQIDEYTTVNEFHALADIKESITAAGFRQYSSYEKIHCEYYDDTQQLLRQLQQTGTNHVKFGTSRYVGRQYFARLASNYEKYRQSQGLPLTYQIISGVGRMQ